MKKHLGFTLIELIAVMVIGSILAAVAIPNLSDFIDDNRISTQTNDLIADLYLARTEAIKRNRRITVCKSTTTTAATPVCNTGNTVDWTTGWIVFVDDGSGGGTTSDGLRQAGEELLRVHGPMQGSVEVDPRPADATIDNYISYIPRGITQVAGGGSQSGIMRVCDDRGLPDSRAIVISQTGRASAVAPPDSATQNGSCP